MELVCPAGLCDGYWHGDAGMAQRTRTAAEQML